MSFDFELAEKAARGPPYRIRLRRGTPRRSFAQPPHVTYGRSVLKRYLASSIEDVFRTPVFAEVHMKHKGIYTVCLVMLLAASVQAQALVPIPDPLPPIDFAVSPTSPASTDRMDLRISGLWPNECMPQGANVVVNGSTIEVRMLLPGAIDCVEPATCRPILSAYELNVGVGPLATGTYTVFVRAVTCRMASNTRSIGTFTVGIPTGEPNEPGCSRTGRVRHLRRPVAGYYCRRQHRARSRTGRQDRVLRDGGLQRRKAPDQLVLPHRGDRHDR